MLAKLYKLYFLNVLHLNIYEYIGITIISDQLLNSVQIFLS